MKKFAIACAIALATTLSLTSCGDTNYCYDVTVTVTTVLGSQVSTTYSWWGTSNDLKTYEQSLKDAQKQLGISEDKITITSKRTSRSQQDCTPLN